MTTPEPGGRHRIAASSPEVPELTATACGTPMYAARAVSRSRVTGPHAHPWDRITAVAAAISSSPATTPPYLMFITIRGSPGRHGQRR